MKTYLVPAGAYFLGDPCYVIEDQFWEPLLMSCSVFEKPQGFFFDHAGQQINVTALGTFYGDGTYSDQTGCEYPVDSGLIGLVPMSYVIESSKFKVSEYLGDCIDHLHSIGRVVRFDQVTEVYDEGGALNFGGIVIDTDHVEDDEYDDD